MSAISDKGREFSKWCAIADEPKNTARFLRLMRRVRRDRLGELLDEIDSPAAAAVPTGNEQ